MYILFSTPALRIRECGRSHSELTVIDPCLKEIIIRVSHSKKVNVMESLLFLTLEKSKTVVLLSLHLPWC